MHWLIDDGLPQHAALLEAVPGVGNVGKLVVDALVEKHPSTLIARILHPEMPPHSTLDDNGLLVPPSMMVHRVMLPDGRYVVTIGGDLQPMTAAGQHEVAEAILGVAKAGSTHNCWCWLVWLQMSRTRMSTSSALMRRCGRISKRMTFLYHASSPRQG